MKNLFDLIKKEQKKIENSKNIHELNHIKKIFFGKNGYIKLYISKLVGLSKEKKSILGKKINKIKLKINKLLDIKRKKLKKELNQYLKNNIKFIDVSLPGRFSSNGNLHPISQTINLIKKYFYRIGFSYTSSPEIEDDYHNFTALNIPKNHPARTSSDTFWIDKKRLLRTQMSTIQAHIFKKNNKLPIKVIAIGRVYRNDYDQKHTPMFHQVEGLHVDKKVNFKDLKEILYNFLNFFLKKKYILDFDLRIFHLQNLLLN